MASLEYECKVFDIASGELAALRGRLNEKFVRVVEPIATLKNGGKIVLLQLLRVLYTFHYLKPE